MSREDPQESSSKDLPLKDLLDYATTKTILTFLDKESQKVIAEQKDRYRAVRR